MKMIYQLTIGFNDKDKKKQILDIRTIRNRIDTGLAIHNIDGATITEKVKGYWKGDKEKSIRVELCDINEKTVFDLIKHYKESLNQEAIMLCKIPCEIEFV